MLRKKLIPLALAFGILLALTAGAVARDPGEDERARQLAVLRWTGRGIPGDAVLFDPQDALNRGETAQLFTSLLGLRETADLRGYTDIRPQSSYAGALACCVAAGIMSGVGPNSMAPENPVTREMFSVMLARALHFLDETEPAPGESWTDVARRVLSERGVTDGEDPGEVLTGKEALYLLDRALPAYTNTQGAIVRSEGGIALAAAPEVIVSGIASDLVVSAGAEGGMLTLEDLTVSGEVIVCAKVTLFLTGATSVNALRLTAEAKDTQIIVDEGSSLGPIDDSDIPAEEPDPEPERPEEQDGDAAPAPEETAQPQTGSGWDDEPREWPGDLLEARPVAQPQPAAQPQPGETPEGTDAAEDLPQEPYPEPDAQPEEGGTAPAAKPVPDWALDVRPAAAVDSDHPDTPPWDEYTVEALPAAQGEPWDVVIRVHMRALSPYRSGGAGAAFWTGYSLAAPEGATGYRVSYSAAGPRFDEPEAYLLTGGAFTRYFDASRWKTYYVLFSWTGEGETGQSETVVYKLDFTDVELDVESLTTAESLLGRIGPAPLEDLRTGADRLENLYESYTAAVTNQKDDERGSYLEVAIDAAGLREHMTAAGMGSWAGISIAAPQGATGCRYSVYLTLDAARKNFSGKPVVSRDNFSRNVDGLGTPGIRQLTNIAEESQRDYWMVVQWYGGETGTASLTTPVVYHVLLRSLPAGAADGLAADTAPAGDNFGLMEDEFQG